MMLEASALMRAGDMIAAESIYTRIIAEEPNFSEGWNRRATVRFYAGDFDGSLADIEQTLKLEPRHFGAFWGLGMILGLQQDYERAISAFEKLLEIKPNSRDARPRIESLKKAQAEAAV
jgi:tetratricopeptide (TPR) repeat protein